ncbi:MAG: M20/M25/M40 family metallo-hydrolase [Gemmatimonadota bacterium]|nr:M20/M25/M40 family metallo-hydrolase [Gemmatimonadota bacterium]
MRKTANALFVSALALAATHVGAQAPAMLQRPAANDPVQILASRLDLARYKATIKGLTQFGDRRQGTDRNANAVTWIETQLKSYGCANVERITYDFEPAVAGGASPLDSAGRAAAMAARAQGAAFGSAQGGGRMRGMRTRTGVNTDSLAQKDLALRALNMQPTKPGMRQEVYCTKVGSTHPDEMYIIGAHMDGHGWGEAANDDGSGTALVMEIARIMSMPDVKTDRSIRFALWNNEETGLNGARAYVAQREALQGKESPAGSGKYPEPKWLGMIQHDMMMFDHGMPRPDGTMSPEQRPEADVNIEFQSASKMATESQKLAWFFHTANEKYATDYPAAVGPHMTNTDSAPFQDIVPAISLRENERGREVGAGWDPQWHQVTDVFSTYTDKDFKLGLNAAQTTLGAIGLLVGATVSH